MKQPKCMEVQAIGVAEKSSKSTNASSKWESPPSNLVEKEELAIPKEVKEEFCEVVNLRELDVQHDAEHLTNS